MNDPIVEERRRNDSLVVSLVQTMHDDVKALSATLSAHMIKEPLEIQEAIESALKRGYPDGDPDGHRLIHEADIRRAQDRAAFWSKMRYELVKYGLIGFMTWAAYSLWGSFLNGPAK